MNRPLSKLDRLRQNLATAEERLRKALDKNPGYAGRLYGEVSHLSVELAREERLALETLKGEKSP